MTTRYHSKAHPHAALPSEGSTSLISNQTLIEIYTAMLKCRMLSERIGSLAKGGKKSAFAKGSEAVVAATLADTQPDDCLISTGHAGCAALLKGVPLANLLHPFSGRSSVTNLRGYAGQVHTSSGVFLGMPGGRARCSLDAAAIAAGCAFEAKHSNRENVAIAFLKSAEAEDSWHEVFQFALAHNLPILMIRQSDRPVLARGRSRKSAPRHLPIIPVDANDAVAVYRVAHEAISHARRGCGPTLIDCVSLRLAGERKQDSDCILRMERYLQAKGLRPDRIRAGVAQKFTHTLDETLTAARRDARKNRTRGSGIIW